MNLVVISPFRPPVQGVGVYGERLAAELARRPEYERITILANRTDHDQRSTQSGNTSVRRIWRVNDPRSTWEIVRWIARERPDGVWINLSLGMFGARLLSAAAGLAIIPALRALGIRTITTLHEVPDCSRWELLGLRYRPGTEFAVDLGLRAVLASNVVCVTLGTHRALLRDRYGAENVIHLPHGCLTDPDDLFTPPESQDVLAFGTFGPYKGLPILIEAFRRMATRHPGRRLIVAGVDHPRFPGYLGSVRREAAHVPGVDWRGYVPEAELQGILRSVALVVVPSTATTGSSSVVHRAGAAGRPVILSDLPEHRALIADHGLDVEFVPVGDMEALETSIEALLGDPAKRMRMGRQNLRQMSGLTMADTARRYAALLTQPPDFDSVSRAAVKERWSPLA